VFIKTRFFRMTLAMWRNANLWFQNHLKNYSKIGPFSRLPRPQWQFIFIGSFICTAKTIFLKRCVSSFSLCFSSWNRDRALQRIR
jgi:hypothetical protein